MGNCLDCKNCLVCLDSDPTDSFNDDDQAALCTLSKSKGKMFKELNYIPPLGYNSVLAFYPCAEDPWITVATRPYNLRKECSVPSWCPLSGNPDNGSCKSTNEQAVRIMQKIREL